jgi:hypothetical protein
MARKTRKLKFAPLPVRTHVITENDDPIALVRQYCRDIAVPGDAICLAESVVAITQRRAVLPEEVRPGPLARFLSRFPGKDGSLATPPAMQLAIAEVGPLRILAGCAAAALGRVIKKKGLFYLVAGRRLTLIDDIAGTMHPYERHIVLGPKNPGKLVRAIKKATGAEAVIADVNDKGDVDILGITDPGYRQAVIRALKDNPFGNEDEQTPIVILKRRPARFN